MKFINITAVTQRNRDLKPSFRVDVELPTLNDQDANATRPQRPEPEGKDDDASAQSCTSHSQVACISKRGSLDIIQVPLSPEAKLASRWAAMMSPGRGNNNPLEVWGLWGHLVPSQAQRSRAVSASAQCLMDTRISFANGSDANSKMAQRSQIKALGALRAALSSPGSSENRSTALLATFLIWVSCVSSLISSI